MNEAVYCKHCVTPTTPVTILFTLNDNELSRVFHGTAHKISLSVLALEYGAVRPALSGA